MKPEELERLRALRSEIRFPEAPISDDWKRVIEQLTERDELMSRYCEYAYGKAVRSAELSSRTLQTINALFDAGQESQARELVRMAADSFNRDKKPEALH